MSSSASPSQPGRRLLGLRTAVVLIVLAGAVVLLAQRGVVRGLGGGWDFTMIYAGALQVANGQDPYDFDSAFDAYAEAGGEIGEKLRDKGRPRDEAWFVSLYPPTTYTLMSPLGLLNWSQARAAWLAVNLLAVGIIGWWMLRNTVAGPGTVAWRCGVLGLAFWLGSGALHTALAFGQLPVVVLVLMLPAVGWTLGPRKLGASGGGAGGASGGASGGRPRVWVAAVQGLMLACAGLMKPQLVGPIAVVLLFTPRRAVAAWAAGWAAAVMAGSLLWVAEIEPSWLEHWRNNLNAFTASGFADPSGANPYTYQMIHLEPWLHRWWPGGVGPEAALRWAGLLLPVALWLGVTGLYAWRRRRADGGAGGGAEPRYFLVAALAAVVTLMMAYHRTYDAVILVLPGVWAWRALRNNRRDVTAWVVLAGVLLFTVPGPVALEVWSRGEGLRQWLRETWGWRVWLLPHHSVALVVMAAGLSLRAVREFWVVGVGTAGRVGENKKRGKTGR